jgi:nitrogen fixation NifU-like protein
VQYRTLKIKVKLSHCIYNEINTTFGCLSAIAASSLATEKIKGRTLDEALDLKNSELAEELSLPPVKIHCSVLAEGAIKRAVQNFKDKS